MYGIGFEEFGESGCRKAARKRQLRLDSAIFPVEEPSRVPADAKDERCRRIEFAREDLRSRTRVGQCQCLVVRPFPLNECKAPLRAKDAQPFPYASLGVGEVPDDVPRHDKVESFIAAVERSGVAHAKVDSLPCLFGFPAGSIDHLRREIDSGDCMAQFSEPKREEASSASHVQHSSRCLTRETRKQIQPCLALLLARETVSDLIVERACAPIPMIPDDPRDLVATAAHDQTISPLVAQLDERTLPSTVSGRQLAIPLPAPVGARRAWF